MKTKIFGICLILAMALAITHIAVTPVYSMTLDDEDDDREDFEDYLEKVMKNADMENFSTADEYLEKAKKLGVNKNELEEAEKYVTQKKQERDARLAARRKAEEEARRQADAKQRRQSSSSGSSSSSSSGSSRGIIGITFETGGFLFSTELEKYTVTIKKTNNLDGKADYYSSEYKQEGSTGFLFGGPATFYDMDYGYYEIEASGYSSGKKVFHVGWKNVRHNCRHSQITVYGDNRQPYLYCNN